MILFSNNNQNDEELSSKLTVSMFSNLKMKPPSQIYFLDDDLLDEVADDNFPEGEGSCS